MGRPSKFTAENRRKVIEAAMVGATRPVQAQIAGIGLTTLKRWVEKAKESPPDSVWGRFLADLEQAEAHPKMRALGVVYKAMEDRPDLAWKFIERRVDGYAPPMPNTQPPVQQVMIALSFPDGSSAAL